MTKIRLHPFIADSRTKTQDAVEHFAKLVKSTEVLRARVYSIVDYVVNLDLFDMKSSLYEFDVASNLAKLGLCERCDETTISEVSHNIFYS